MNRNDLLQIIYMYGMKKIESKLKQLDIFYARDSMYMWLILVLYDLFNMAIVLTIVIGFFEYVYFKSVLWFITICSAFQICWMMPKRR